MSDNSGLEGKIYEFTYGKKSPSHQVCMKLISSVRDELSNLGYQSLSGNVFGTNRDRNKIHCYGLNFEVLADPCHETVYLVYESFADNNCDEVSKLRSIIEDKLHVISNNYGCLLDVDTK